MGIILVTVAQKNNPVNIHLVSRKDEEIQFRLLLANYIVQLMESQLNRLKLWEAFGQ